MTFNFPTPLRLSVGSHKAGSGKGCAMNVISWENGDTTITDFPECADMFLSRIVQRVNDQICKHTKNTSLCPDCSIKVLAIAHRTVGTNLTGTHTDRQRAEIYAKIARTEVFYAANAAYATTATAAANAAYATTATAAAHAAYATTATAAAHAAYAAAHAAYAAAHAAYDDAAAYAATAAYDDAAAYAATAAYDDAAAYTANATFLVDQANRIIDQFEAFSGIKAPPVDSATVARAVEQMAVGR